MPGDMNRASVGWELPEVVGSGLLLIYAILIATGIVSAILLEAKLGPHQVNGVSGFVSANLLGEVFQQGTFWAEPQVAVFFIIGSMGMGWWQNESHSSNALDVDPDRSVHIRRAQMIVKVGITSSILCIIGGVLFVVGHSLVTSPSDDWSTFTEALGVAIGSVALGLLGVFAGRWVLSAHDDGVTAAGD